MRQFIWHLEGVAYLTVLIVIISLIVREIKLMRKEKKG